MNPSGGKRSEEARARSALGVSGPCPVRHTAQSHFCRESGAPKGTHGLGVLGNSPAGEKIQTHNSHSIHPESIAISLSFPAQ